MRAHIIAALGATALATIALTACSTPEVRVVETYSEPAPYVQEEAATTDGITDADAEQFTRSVCTVIDNIGVSQGLLEMYSIGLDSGIDSYDLGVLIATAVQVGCPEYSDDIDRFASGG